MRTPRLATCAVAVSFLLVAGCESVRSRTAREDVGGPVVDMAALPEWIRHQLAEAKVAASRAELDRKFSHSGGGLFSDTTYVVRDFHWGNVWLMFNVGFRPADMPRATWWDVRRQLAWRKAHDHHVTNERPDDVVEYVGPPYRGYMGID